MYKLIGLNQLPGEPEFDARASFKVLEESDIVGLISESMNEYIEKYKGEDRFKYVLVLKEEVTEEQDKFQTLEWRRLDKETGKSKLINVTLPDSYIKKEMSI